MRLSSESGQQDLNLRPLGIMWLKTSILSLSCCISCCIISLKHLFFAPFLACLSQSNSDLNGFHAYTKLSNLGLSDGATVNDILPKMTSPSIGFFYVFSDNIKNLPITSQANLIIFKAGSACDVIERSIWTGTTHFGKYSGTNTVGSWVQL